MIPETAFRSGSECPPLKPGVLRLYSMRFCPYAHRTRIVLAYKNIPHEVVNIHLREKPEWYIQNINPLGNVPAIQKDNVTVFDSIIVNEYLDSVYPEDKLMPEDVLQLAKDRMLLEKWSQAKGDMQEGSIPFFSVAFMKHTAADRLVESVVKPYYALLFSGCEDKDAGKELFDAMDIFEEELVKRGTPFFGGKEMGMIDVNLYPHAERICLFELVNPDLKVEKQRFPKFLAWIETMKQVPAVKSTATDSALHTQFIQMVKAKNADYDLGLK